MAMFDYQKREINLKVVYYGPGLSGKTTNIQYIFDHTRPENKGKLVSLATQTDRTLFFDFLPIELGTMGGYKVRFHLYTVPGQVYYDATRKLVLKGVDGIVFVADSQREMKEANIQSLVNMEKNLLSYNKKLREIPVVFQANKRDLPGVMSVEEMNEVLNRHRFPLVEACAPRGKGVLETLRLITKLVIRSMKDRVEEEGSSPLKVRGAVPHPPVPPADPVSTPAPDYPLGPPAETEPETVEEMPSPPAPVFAGEEMEPGERGEEPGAAAAEPATEPEVPAGLAQALSIQAVPVILAIPGVGKVELSLRVEVAGIRLVAAEADAGATGGMDSRPAPPAVPPIAEEGLADMLEPFVPVETGTPPPPLFVPAIPLEPLALNQEPKEEQVRNDLPPLSASPSTLLPESPAPEPGQAPLEKEEEEKETHFAEGYDPSFGELEFSDHAPSSGSDGRGGGKGEGAGASKGGLFGIFRKK